MKELNKALFIIFSILCTASYGLISAEAAIESTPLQLGQDESLMVIVGLNVQPSGGRRTSRALQEKLLDSLSEDQVQLYARFESLPFVALRVDSAALQKLYKSPFVTSVQEDVPMPPLLESSTALIGAPALWNAGYEGTAQAVVLLDSGIDANHPFFGGRVVAEACFSNAGGTGGGTTLCPNGSSEQSGSGSADVTIAACDGGSLCQHGSHLAGIAAGNGVSFDGVARGADIIAIQAFTRFDGGPCGTSSCVLSYTSDQLKALDYVATLSASHEIAAVNISLGYSSYSDQALCDAHNQATKMAIDKLRSLGIATIIAAGNDGLTNALTVPACISSAVAVSATTDEDQVASFSNIHEMVDLLAPGVSITSSVPVDAFSTMSGTSVATPHVTGAWALLKSIHPSATVDDILSALQDYSVPISDTRPSGTISKPRIQLDLAAQRLMPATWLGESSSWQEANNWSTGLVPSCIGASATIPSAPAGGYFPTIDGDSAVGTLIIEDGALLEMSAHTLSICGDLDVQDTGLFNALGGTLLFKGQRQQAIRMSNGQLFHLQIGDGAQSPFVTLESDLDINGDLNIMSAASLDGGRQTIKVAGTWHEHVNSFIPSSSRVILDGQQQTISKVTSRLVLAEDFSERDDELDRYFYFPPPLGWAVANEGQGYPWLFGYSSAAPNTPDRGGHARYIWNGSASASADTWLFTPQLSLYPALTYRLEFSYGAKTGNLPEKLAVSLGTEQSALGMGTLLYSTTNITNTSWQTATITFTVPSDGLYHLGFHAYSDAGSSELALDDITLSAKQELTFHNLTVNGEASVQSDVRVQNDLLIRPNGLLKLETNDLSVAGSVTNHGEVEQRRAISDSSGNTTYDFLTIKNAADSQPKYHGVQITPDGGAALGMTSVRIGGHQSCTSPTDPQLIQRCFEITPSSPNSATIRYWFSEAERNGRDADGIKIWDWKISQGGSWTQVGHSPAYGSTGEGNTACSTDANCWFEWQGIDSYSPMTSGDGSQPPTGSPSAPLSIQLASFSATERGTSILLTWQTVSELNNLGFNLYRHACSPPTDECLAANPLPNTPLNPTLIPSQVPGSGQGSFYEWADEALQLGTTYLYWLESVELNGNSSHHGPIEITPVATTSIQLAHLHVSPPPSELAITLLILLSLGYFALLRVKH